MNRTVRRADPALLVPGLAWGVLALGIHKVGVLQGWYGAYPWFQNVTHAASASGVAVLAGLLALHLGVRGRRVVAVVVLATSVGAFGWEAVEFVGLLDAYGMYFHFHGLHDAAVDMVSNAAGTALAAVALRTWTGLEPVDPDDSTNTSP